MIETQRVTYRDTTTSLNGLLAWDSAHTGRRPGILVVHGGAGVDDHAIGRARWLAACGFVALACDMYGEGVAGNRERVMQTIAHLRRDRAALCQRAQVGINVLKSHPDVDGRLAAVGYCFGGMVVLELARGGARLAGVVSVHGSLATEWPAAPDTIDAKILVCHGAQDPHVPMTQVTAFAEEMTGARVDWQVAIYGEAMHGFTHETATGQQAGVMYHALSDARSSSAINTFLGEVFA